MRDTSSFGDILTDGDWFDDLSPTFVAGSQGSGRTNTALALGDEWRENGGSVSSNIQSCDETTLTKTARDVVSWAQQTPGPKLTIIDEMTTLFNHQRRMRPVLGKLVSRLHMVGVKVVFVVDEIPEWAGIWGATCIKKTSRTTAEVYDGGAPVEVANIPPTNVTYDPCEMTVSDYLESEARDVGW